VRLLRAPKQAKGAVRALHYKWKRLLQGCQRVAAHGVEPADLRCAQGLRPVHVIRLQVLVDGHDHSRDRVSDLGFRVGLRKAPRFRPDAHFMQNICTPFTDINTLNAVFECKLIDMHSIIWRGEAPFAHET
jgi:hypothetical protein